MCSIGQCRQSFFVFTIFIRFIMFNHRSKSSYFEVLERRRINFIKYYNSTIHLRDIKQTHQSSFNVTYYLFMNVPSFKTNYPLATLK